MLPFFFFFLSCNEKYVNDYELLRCYSKEPSKCLGMTLSWLSSNIISYTEKKKIHTMEIFIQGTEI